MSNSLTLLGFQLHHLFPTELSTSTGLNARDAKLFLDSIGFDIEWQGNKRGLFVNVDIVAQLQSSSQDMRDAFKDAGFGENQHNGSHPNYNNFIISALNDLADEATSNADPTKHWDAAAKSAAVFDLLRFVDDAVTSGSLAVHGTPIETWQNAWDDWRASSAYPSGIRDYAALTSQDAIDIAAYKGGLSKTATSAEEGRKTLATELFDKISTASLLEGKELDRPSQAILNGNKATAIATPIIHSLLGKELTGANGTRAILENLAVGLGGDETGGGPNPLDALIPQLEGIFNTLGNASDLFPARLSDFGDAVIESAAKSIGPMVVGAGGSIVGDVVEFLNLAYEPMKTGFQTGDWSDFYDVSVEYGVAAAASAILIGGGIAIAGAVAGPVVASFIGAGFAAYGLYEAITNGVELFGKITNDLAEVIERAEESIVNFALGLDEGVAQLARAVAYVFGVDPEHPVFNVVGETLITKYLVDPLQKGLPGSLDGTDTAEWFFGKNYAVINAGGGNDELYVEHASIARGEAGDDVIIGRRSRRIQAGQAIDPNDPDSPLADSDLVMQLEGGEGDDWIFLVGGDGGIVRGGPGDDVLVGGGAETHMYGGSGADVFQIGAKSIVHDAELTGDSIWMGIPIFGGTKQWWMEGNTAYWSPFSTLQTAFPVIGSEVLSAAAFFVDVATMKFASFQSNEDGSLGINIGYGLGGVAKIENYQLDLDTGAASGGVVVFETGRADGEARSGLDEPSKDSFTQFINLALKAGFGVGFTGWDPIVLDLDGDGYELTTQRNSGVHFEFDGDGFAEKTGWVRPDDGFLVLDANANGIVDDSSEFFGDETQGGFVELATHDLNSDGVIDANDAVFTQLQVWRDLNSDGVTDQGELVTLTDLNITSISVLGVAPAEAIDIGGNTIAAEAAFTFADGTTGMAGDVVLDISHIDTRYITDTTVSAPAAALPELRGFGNVADLSIAMSEDAALLAQVQAFDQLATNDLAVLKQCAEDILYAWAGVDNVAVDPIGGNGFDARKLAFLEAFSGQAIAPRDPMTGAVSTAGLAEMEASWADTLESLTLRLVIQSSGLPAFADMTYREDIDTIVMGGPDTLKQAYEAVLGGLSSDPATALAEWEAWGDLLRAVQDGSRRFDNNVVRSDFAAAQLQAAIIASGTTLELDTLAPALGISNLVVGTNAAETLTQNSGGTIFSGIGDGDVVQGRGGQDVYLIESGFGSIIIDDEEARQSGDRIRFVDLNSGDVSAARVGDDLVLTVDATGDTVTVLGQFADVVPLSSDVIISSNRGIEEIQFADGAVMEIPDIAIAVGEGTSGDDVMRGTMHTDVFQGREGDDLLMGGDDADLYVFDAGDGADVIREQQTNPLLMAADMVIFGDDIAPEDLAFSRGADANDLVITIGTEGDSITIDNQFAYTSLGYNDKFSPNSRIEVFSFRHYGDVYTHKDIQQQLIASETTDGDDVTRGFGDDDYFAASAGDDVLVGLDGQDTYAFGRGGGNDTIDEQAYYIDINVGLGGLSLLEGADTVVFAPDIAIGDVTFSRESAAPHLTVTLDTGETLTVRNQFDGFQTGLLGSQWFDRMEWFEFADGTRLSWQDVLLDVTTGGDGDDSLWGDLYEDTLTGGLGNDYLSGGGYADTYVFNLGDGQDVIDDDNQFILGDGFVSVDTTPDILKLGAGIVSSDVSLQRNGLSLTLVIGAGGDSITLQSQNDYYHTGVFGAISNSRIERVEFDDGEVWTWQDLNSRAIADQTTAGDDITEGFRLDDRLLASAGDDILRGGDGNDIYEFGIGSGSDRIEETITNGLYGDDDRVEFGAGITGADVSFERAGLDLIVSIVGGADTLTIAGQFDNYIGFTNNDVESFHFEDGTIVTKAEIMADLTNGTSGDDTITGFHTDDTLIGGAGDDSLYGADGSDTYIFNLGDGTDTIYEDVRFANLDDEDRLVFGAGIAPSDISLTRTGNALTLSIDGTADSVTIDGQFAFASWFSWHDVEFFEFADGTVWTKRDISNFLTGGTTGDDVIVGTFENDEINGLEGNDILRGGDGADVYYFGVGYGQDRIEETITNANLDDYDQVVFGDGIVASDLTFARDGDQLTIGIVGHSDTLTIAGQFDNYIGYTNRDVERLQFSDGSVMTKEEIQAILTVGTAADETVLGFHTSDRIDGGAGNDILRGFDGADTYLFGRGSGNDIIRESVEYVQISDADRIEFGADLTLDDIVWSRSGTTLVIAIADTSDTLTIEGDLDNEGITGSTWRDVEFFDFADGTTLTKTDVQNILMTPTDGDDTIDGFWTNDVIAGGLGNDLLRGGQGSDGYLYSLGDGDDVISDYLEYWGSTGDYIEFDATITVADVTIAGVASDRNDLRLNIAGGGSITIDNQLTDSREWTMDEVRFADGTIWDKADLLSRLVSDQISSSADTVYGSRNDDIISSMAGDDIVFANAGADTLEGGAGQDTIHGEAGDDSIEGGEGADHLYGGTGNDTFHYRNGDGDDEIIELAGQGNADTLRLHGIDRSRVVFETYADSNDIAVVISESSAGAGDAARLEMRDTYDTQSDSGLERIEFDDGTVLTKADIAQIALTPASDDVIVGTNGAESFVGGRGDDVITGNGGNDVFIYNRGDGFDTFQEWRWHGWDRVSLHEIDPSDVTLQRNGNNVRLVIAESAPGAGDAGEIYLNGGGDGSLVNFGSSGFERIDFDDGTQWTPATMRAMVLADARTSGDDTISGFTTSDLLEGGQGSDTLYGNDGNDHFVYTRGDGNDTFQEWRWHGWDRVSLHEIAPSDVTLQRDGNNVRLIIAESAPGAGDAGEIYLNGGGDGSLVNFGSSGFERIDFDDGTQWTPATMRAMVLADAGTAGDDTISGFTTNDLLEGGLGSDTLYGNDGNDHFVYTRGDGNDTFQEWRWHGWDRVSLHGIDPSDVTLQRDGNNVRLVIAESAPGAGDAGEIYLNGGGDGSLVNFGESGFESIDFDDGTQWTPATMRAMVLADAGTAGDDTIYGFSSADVLEGGLGDDTIYGSDGDDRYIYSRGDGNDRYGDYRYQENDTVQLTDILPNEVVFYSSGAHVFAKVLDSSDGAGDGSLLTFWDSTSADSTGIDRIEFADGSALADDHFLPLRYTMGTDGDDIMAGGTVNDRLFADYGNDELTGGIGDDVLNGSYGSDTAVYSGISAEYTIITDAGLFQLRDDETATGDNEGTDTLIGIETLRFGDATTVGITSPIILDLDGDGLETIAAADSVASFDLNGDGIGDDTSWIGSGDGFLFIDRDGNGTVSGVDEISFIDDAPNAATDLDGLQAFDSNDDGILDNADLRFDDFGVWQDANGNGATDTGEIFSLAQAGIASINLTATVHQSAFQLGEVAIANVGEFTLSTGERREFADAALTYFSGKNDPASQGSQTLIGLISSPPGELVVPSWYDLLAKDLEGHRIGHSSRRADVFDMLRDDVGLDLFDLYEREYAASPVRLRAREQPVGTSLGESPGLLAWAKDPSFSFSATQRPVALDNWLAEDGSVGLQAKARYSAAILDGPGHRADRGDAARRMHVMPSEMMELSVLEQNGATIRLRRDLDMAKRLQLLRQDMAAFGPSGFDDSLVSRGSNRELVDFFA